MPSCKFALNSRSNDIELNNPKISQTFCELVRIFFRPITMLSIPILSNIELFSNRSNARYFVAERSIKRSSYFGTANVLECDNHTNLYDRSTLSITKTRQLCVCTCVEYVKERMSAKKSLLMYCGKT